MDNSILLKIIDVAGGTVSAVIVAIVGYFVWLSKSNKNRQRNEDSKNKIILDKIDEIGDSVKSISDSQGTLIRATKMALENDIIQFRAFRKDGRLNGDSEAQEHKLEQFFLETSFGEQQETKTMDFKKPEPSKKTSTTTDSSDTEIKEN